MKKKSILLLLPFAAMALAGCGDNPTPPADPCESAVVQLNKTTLSLEVGASETLTASMSVEGCDLGEVTWSSDHPEIAKVENGKVTALAVGTAKIIANGAECVVTVVPKGEDVVHVESIKKVVSAYSIEIGQTASITAEFTPTNATDKQLIYSVDKEGIVSIAADGTVTGLAEGSVDITVTSHDNPNASFVIQGFKVIGHAIVLPTSTSSGYSMVESGDLVNGDYVQFIVENGGHIYGMQTYETGNNVASKELSIASDTINDGESNGMFIIEKNADNTYSFRDSNGKYLSAAGGSKNNYLKVVDTINNTAKFNVSIVDGKATIVCADSSVTHGFLYFNSSASVFSCYVDKTGDKGYPLVSLFVKTPEQKAATGVEFAKTSYLVDVGSTATVSAKVLPLDATDREIAYTLEEVSPAGCMTIEGNVITATAVGTAKVVATTHDGGFTANATVTAVQYNYGSATEPLSVTQAMEIINAQCVDPDDVTHQEIWCTGEVSVLGDLKSYGYQNTKISDGTSEVLVYSINLDATQIEEYAVGKTVIFHGYAKNFKGTLEFATNGDKYVTATYVGGPIVEASGVTMDQKTLDMEVGQVPVQLSATVTPAEALNKAVSYSSDHPEIASVTADGLVTAVAEGTATITVTTAKGGFTDTCAVTVSPATRKMTGITAEGLTKVEYDEGDTLDLTGLVVKAVYDSGDPEVIVGGYTTNIASDHPLELTDTSLVVSYNGFDATPITLTINEKRAIVEEGTYTIHHVRDGVTYYLSLETGTKGQPAVTTDASKAAVFDFALKTETLDTYTLKVHDENLYLAIGADDNNGIRFSSTAFEWKITKGSLANGAYDLSGVYNSKTRFLTMYNNSDFRCYESATHANRKENTDLTAVEVKTVESIAIKQNPTKMTYYVGEAFDPTGMVVTVTYTDTTTEDITEGFTFEGSTGFTAANPDRTVKITYKSHNAYVQHVAVIEDERTLAGIEFAEGSDMTKKEYKEGESWDAAGLTVNDVYSDESREAATEGVTLAFNPAAPAVGVESVTVTATKEGCEPVSITITGITVAELPKNVDEISAAALGVTSGSYTSFSNVSLISGAKYSGMVAKNSSNGVIQLTNAEKGLYSVESLRTLKSISATFNANTSNDRSLEIYAKHGSFASTQDIEGATKVATFTKTADATEFLYSFEDLSNYTNILIRASGAVYLDELIITWSESKADAVVFGVSLDNAEATVNMGESLTLNATVDGYGANYDKVTWESSDTSKVTVVDGVLTPVAVTEEPVTITATSVVDSTKSATCAISVAIARNFTGLSTEGGFKTSYTEEDTDFAINDLKVFADYDNDDHEEITDYTVTWSTAFDKTVGNHSSTPTIHWDGHDLELSPVSYAVAEAVHIKYSKVTAEQVDWSGTYVMLCENASGNYIFDRSITTDNNQKTAVELVSGKVQDPTTTQVITIEKCGDGYSIKLSDGKYLAGTGKAENKTAFVDNPYELNISYDADNGLTICTNGTNVQYLRANYNGGSPIFRFYKEASKTTGAPVALYKLEA